MDSLLSNSIIDIIDKYSEFFLSKENVVGLGLGFKNIKNLDTLRPALKVFVSKKIPQDKLSKHLLIPKEFLGIETDVIETGQFKTLVTTKKKEPPLDVFARPIVPSVGIGTTAKRSYATLSCIVFSNRSGKPYILANNHAIAQCNKLPIGVSIVQPSLFTTGIQNKYRIGQLYYFINMNYGKRSKRKPNLVDCALGSINNDIEFSTYFPVVGKVKKTKTPKPGMKVKKIGTTTGITYGTITAINSLTSYDIDEEPAYFAKQIITSKMAEPGDSGSILFSEDNYMIGMLISGSSKRCFFTPIDTVLK
ncbi:MAG: hypothetical protein ACRC7R_10770, partial [Sarcina sp.]